MARWQGKSKGTTSGYRIFIMLLRTTGISGAYLLLRFVAGYYFLFSYKTSKPIYRFYRDKIKLSAFDSVKKIYRNYFLLGQSIIDKVAIMSGIKTGFTFDFDGENYLREMTAEGKGGLLLSGHLGNWEAAGQLLRRLNTTINIVMYDGEDARIKEYIESVTGTRSFNVIYIRSDLSHIYEITKALSENQLICMHADRFLPETKTVSCNFFGIPARFPEGPFLLALKLRSPVAYVYAFKEQSRHYHFYSTPVKQFDSNNGDSVHSIAVDYASHLETMARKYPEQWFNYYNFWQN
jgi:predicted LPLAT superfamily acyltransferase